MRSMSFFLFASSYKARLGELHLEVFFFGLQPVDARFELFGALSEALRLAVEAVSKLGGLPFRLPIIFSRRGPGPTRLIRSLPPGGDAFEIGIERVLERPDGVPLRHPIVFTNRFEKFAVVRDENQAYRNIPPALLPAPPARPCRDGWSARPGAAGSPR